MEGSITWVGIDAHKKTLAVAVLAPKATPEQFTIDNNERAIRKLSRRLQRTARGGEVRACYEAVRADTRSNDGWRRAASSARSSHRR